MYSIYQKLLDEKGLKNADIARATDISNMTLSDWKNGKSTPKQDKLMKIADFLGVSLEYLMTGKDTHNTDTLSPKDDRDIKKDLDSIMQKLTNKKYGPAAYDGEDLSDESIELFRDELEIALKRLKLINKEKYNPKKNKE